MDDFEKLAFAGMQPDQYNILWVRHSHANHHELHFVIPRVELSTGKAFNAFPPGWQKDFDVLRDLYNCKEDWARPDDPARARFCTPDHADLHQARLKRWGVEVLKDERSDAKNAIHNYLRLQIESGQVKDRADVILKLEAAGMEINRTGKDYITIKDPNSDAKLRLKGGIYREDWKLGPINGQNEQQSATGYAEPGNGHRQRIRELSQQLQQCLAKRAGYNQQRYCQENKANTRTDQHANENTKHQLRQTLACQRLYGNEYSVRPLPGNLEYFVFGRSKGAQPVQSNQQPEPKKAAANTGRESPARRELGYQPANTVEWSVHSVANERRNFNPELDGGRSPSHKTGVAIDGTKNYSIGAPEQARYRSQADLHGTRKPNQRYRGEASGIRAELANFEQALQQLNAAYQGVEQYCAKQVELTKRKEISKSRDFEM